MKTEIIKYYLKEDGKNKKYVPTKTEMDIILNDINGFCEYTLGNSCAICSVKKNLVTFNCEDIVFNEYGSNVLEDPDDDGNYYVTRKDKNGKNISLGWYATKVSTIGGHKSSKTRKNRRLSTKVKRNCIMNKTLKRST